MNGFGIGIAALFRSFGLTREQGRLAWKYLEDAPAPDSWEDAWDQVEAAIFTAILDPGWGPATPEVATDS